MDDADREQLACPWCGDTKATVDHWWYRLELPEPPNRFSVNCGSNACAASGPWADSESGAVAAWNRVAALAARGVECADGSGLYLRVKRDGWETIAIEEMSNAEIETAMAGRAADELVRWIVALAGVRPASADGGGPK